ncbi:MAG: putative minor tail protein [Prokaryotic dsDNA virus sp.]|nr:MAG: putative minor tail protein [Prokaryotic dsDNA virus sp.]|tara:strand:+ start:5567 stop:7768 length:2202 start_codon:yes stop_codon:yes gene_type:complete
MAKSVIIKITQKGAKKTAGALKKVGSAVTSLGKASALVGGGFAVLSTKLAGDFQKSLLEVSTLMGKMTDGQMKRMSKELRLVSQTSGLALDSLSKAKYDIVSAGFSNAAESAEVLATASKLAVGGVTSAAEAADLLTTALNAMGKDASEVNEVSDSLFTTVRLGKTTMTELASSMGQVLPFARSAGLSLDGVNSAMATITASGISTAQATTSLRAALVSLTSPADSSREAMEEAGIEIKRFDDGTLDLVGTVKQFQGLDPDTFKKIIPRVEAILGIQTMANNFQTLSENVEEFGEKSAGATEKAFEKMAGGFNQQMLMLKNSTQSVMIEVGNVIIDVITPVLKDVNKEFATLGQIGFDNLGAAIRDDLPLLMNVLKQTFIVAFEFIEDRASLMGYTIIEHLKSAIPGIDANFKIIEAYSKQLSDKAEIDAKFLANVYTNAYGIIKLKAEERASDDFEITDNIVEYDREKHGELFANREQLMLKDFEGALATAENIKAVTQEKVDFENAISRDQAIKFIEDRNVSYNAVLAAHDQFIDTLTDTEMHGAERRKLIQEAIKNSAIRFIGEHTKAFIKNKMQEALIEDAVNKMKLGSQQATALQSFLIEKGSALASVIVSMARGAAKAIAASMPIALVTAPAIIATVAAIGKGISSKIESAQIGFADGGIVPGTGQGDTVPAMLTPGELILNQAQQDNLVGGLGGITINFNGPITNDEYVKDFILPEIEKTISQGLA